MNNQIKHTYGYANYLKLAMCILGVALLGACTENQRAKSYGGTTVIEIPAHEKLVNLTWKDENLWVLKRARRDGEAAETYTFKEQSRFGMLEGTVTITEQPSATPAPRSGTDR